MNKTDSSTSPKKGTYEVYDGGAGAPMLSFFDGETYSAWPYISLHEIRWINGAPELFIEIGGHLVIVTGHRLRVLYMDLLRQRVLEIFVSSAAESRKKESDCFVTKIEISDLREVATLPEPLNQPKDALP